MHKVLKFSCFLGMVVNPFLVSAENEMDTNLTQNLPQIHYSLNQDGRNWKIANKSESNDITVLQYVVDNDQTGDCCELLSVMYIKGLDTPPEKNFELFAEELKKQAGSSVNKKIISKDANSLLGEWSIDDHSPNDMREWIRIFSDGKNTAILKYTTTKLKDGDDKGKVWGKNFK